MSGTIQDLWFDQLTTRQLHDLLRLRCDVFVVEQNCPYAEVDGLDLVARHVWIDSDGDIVAALRVIPDDDHVKVGRVVTHPQHRSRGLARRLLLHVLDDTHMVEIEAQAHLADWYRGFGFELTGPEFDLDGIAHVPMKRVPAVG